MNALSTDKLIVLFALAAANFVVGMGAFMVIGLNLPVATAFGIDPSASGQMMTIYAATYAVASPLMVAMVGRFDRRTVVMAGMALFAAGALASALSPQFWMLLISRALMAIGAGIMTPVAASIGVVLSPPEKRGFALSVIFGGIAVAQVTGVPAGAALAYWAGWHAAFVVVAVLAVVSVLVLQLALPHGIIVPATSLRSLATALLTPRLSIAVAYTAILMTACYIVYTYLAPIFESRFALSGQGITLMLTVFGLGAVLGNMIGGQMTDRIGALPTLIAISILQLFFEPAIANLIAPLWMMIGLAGLWAVTTWAFMVPQQARLSSLDPALAPVLLAMNASAIYIGASLGAAIGGQILRHGEIGVLGWTAAAIALVALVSLFYPSRAQKEI